MEWQPIDSAPTSEESSYLVLCPGNDMCGALMLQVSNFEGGRYPDHLGANIDWEDNIDSATHWMPLPEPPK